MAIDLVASRPHYLAHLLPVWWALPEDRRGAVYAPGSRGLVAVATRAGLPVHTQYPPRSPDPVLVAGGNDLAYHRGRPVVLLEHGAGQTYTGLDDPAHAGGRGRDAVSLFCHPREETAARDRARYPAAQVEVVGCPRLDEWHRGEIPGSSAGFARGAHYESIERSAAPGSRDPGLWGSPTVDPPTVGITFHFPGEGIGVPEARWAWPHYERLALEVLALRYNVVGHAHPRAAGWLRNEYRTVGIRYEPDIDAFFGAIDVLAADNTSALPEFASATGRPLVFLNAPWYRRDWSHGCRFWNWTDGQVEVAGPGDLVDGVTEALLDDRRRTEARRAMCGSVYGFDDGLASARVAGLITARW